MASPFVLIAIGVWLKVKTRAAKEPDSGTRESAREVGRTLFFLGFMFVVGIVVLGSGMSTSVIVIGGFVLGLGTSVLVLFAIFAPFLPRTLIRLRSIFGKRRELHRGIGRFFDRRLEEALDAFRRHHEQFPDDPEALHWQSAVLVEWNQLDAALELADEGIAMNPTASGLMQRSELLLTMACDELALADAVEASRLDPSAPALAYVKGAALISLRRPDEAIAALRAERLARRTVFSRYALGDAHRLRSELTEAEKAYRQAAKLAPAFVRLDPHRSDGPWARALAQVGWFEHAQRHIAKALAKLPNDPSALYARAICEQAADDRDALAATMSDLLKVRPTAVAGALADPQFTPLLAEKRFRELLAWALGAQRQTRERVLGRRSGA